MDLKLDEFRREYLRGGLKLAELSVDFATDPIELFQLWMKPVIAEKIPA